MTIAQGRQPEPATARIRVAYLLTLDHELTNEVDLSVRCRSASNVKSTPLVGRDCLKLLGTGLRKECDSECGADADRNPDRGVTQELH